VGSKSEAVIAAPLPAAYCSIEVQGKGSKATETDYLPHVVQCENGGADLQALKAQAIAARSVAYYNMANQGSICDGQGCQVYSCGGQPNALQIQAVEETSGQYLSYDSLLTYGFYVAGDKNCTPPGCVGNTANSATEKWVTYNDGKSGGDVQQTARRPRYPSILLWGRHSNPHGAGALRKARDPAARRRVRGARGRCPRRSERSGPV
jgi:hypothetical protein